MPEIKLLPKGIIAVSGASAFIDVEGYSDMEAQLDVDAPIGAPTSLDVLLETSSDGLAADAIAVPTGSFTQVTNSASEQLRHVTDFFRYVRARWTVVGGVAGVFASLTTALAGTNNDLTFTAKASGTGGNAITIAYVASGNNTPLSVGVVGNAITVNLATGPAGAITSTAADVAAAIAASVAATALVGVKPAPANAATGLVTALGATNLAGGVAAVGYNAGVTAQLRST